MPLLKKFIVACTILFSACQSAQNFKTPEELGSHVFDRMARQDSKSILSLVVNASDVKTAFMNNEEFAHLSAADKETFAGETAEKNKVNATVFVNRYTRDEEKFITLLKTAIPGKTVVEIREENGTRIAFITVPFNSNQETHELRLRAARVDDHWKLLYWIEIL